MMPHTTPHEHILILDDLGTPSLSARANFTDFISPEDRVHLLIITSESAATEKDKHECLEVAEIEHPTSNGSLELIALRMHEQHRIDRIYTRQEDLILRAAHLRKLLGIPEEKGMRFDDAICFRDKYKMKEYVAKTGFSVPEFRRVFSPCDVIAFIKEFGYPVVVKPTLGSASANVRVLKTDKDRDEYLGKHFYDRIDEGGRCMDYSGDIIIESFAKGSMCHVNGYAQSGKIEISWPFEYLNTNFGFTQGNAYGNILVPRSSPSYKPMLDAAQQVLDSLPCPDHLLFHLEMFCDTESPYSPTNPRFTLCEIAARRPGGSIGPLINLAEGGSSTNPFKFQEIEFRLSNGLQVRQNRNTESPCAKNQHYSVADLIVPLRVGTLVKVPDAKSCPVGGVQVLQVAQPGRKYKGFDINTMNTCVRFVTQLEESEGRVSIEKISERLKAAKEWYDREVVYTLDDASEASPVEQGKIQAGKESNGVKANVNMNVAREALKAQ
ncbi:hypothetical protein HDV05_006945 [Chytridiales sp. JEL 0842]|nr:hypothetical protein HDV05_006945 [Chytridiales sp. JEL 0842]